MNGLLIINFILVIIALSGLLLLFLRQKQMDELKRQYEELNEKFVELMDEFLLEIREENERFIEDFTRLLEKENSSDKREKQETSFEEKPFLKDDPNPEEKASPEDEQVPTTEKKDMQNSSFENFQDDVEKIATYLKEGYSIAEIAKALDRGKTEIELLIKFTPALMNIHAKNVQE
ncbi:MAG: helix-turn-helix domain-containing protein [Caldibacillus sp.]